jgi:hypothetical protein
MTDSSASNSLEVAIDFSVPGIFVRSIFDPAKIAGYDVKIVPPPGGTVDDEYPRFVIALGLTSENLHFNQYRLPSRYSAVPTLPSRELSVRNYADTKDLT